MVLIQTRRYDSECWTEAKALCLQDGEGLTPLHLACMHNRQNLAMILMNRQGRTMVVGGRSKVVHQGRGRQHRGPEPALAPPLRRGEGAHQDSAGAAQNIIFSCPFMK